MKDEPPLQMHIKQEMHGHTGHTTKRSCRGDGRFWYALEHPAQTSKCPEKLDGNFLKPTVSFCVRAVAQGHAIFVKLLLHSVENELSLLQR